MKLIAQTFIILAAALAVSGIAYLAVERSGAAQSAAFEGAQRPPQDGAQGGPPAGFERGGRAGGGLFAIAQVLKSLAIVAVITAIVAPIAGLLRRRAAPAASTAEDSEM